MSSLPNFHPMSAFHCQYPDHEGSRLRRDRRVMFSKRIEYVRLDGKERIGVVTQIRLCETCARKDMVKLRGEQPEEHPSLW